ncbi:MAG: DUF938 domain-containing protein [Alphaproteobacteria bacterium]|nr:DUF938 domain-containing protein [Alphaproteobacteria bacterium]
MRKPVENFARDIGPADTEGRLDAPSFHKNKDGLAAEIGRLLGDRSGDVLEIGSGTGQHAVTFAALLPQITFWPSDPVDDHLGSIDAWRRWSGLANVKPATHLDCLEPVWTLGNRELHPQSLEAAIAINVIHIAPWAVAEAMFAGAGKYLRPGGLMIFYGPYKKDGQHISQGNIDFDQALRSRNPAFGIRNLEDLVACGMRNGLQRHEVIEMAANNTLVVFAA